MMSFLAPFTLVGLALLALPVLIHLLVRRRAGRLDFPSLRFLRETPSFRLYPRHVRQPLLMALRLAALALIILGLARPFMSLSARNRHTRVIMIDASLSMSTRGRAEAAREQARLIINRLGAGERAGLIAFSSDASVLAEATGDREALGRALQSYEPTGSAADYGAGLAAAAAMLQRVGPGTAEIELISDFQQSGLTARSLELAHTAVDARVLPYAVGTEIERNAFLTDERVMRGAGGVVLSATEIVSEAEGQTGMLRAWTIDAGRGARPDLEWRTESNGQITGVAKASAPDDFDADDGRFFAFAPPRDNRALLVETDAGGAGPYLGAALEAATVGQPDGYALDRRKQLPGSAVELAPYALVVFVLHGAPRLEDLGLLGEYASAGGAVWLCLARDVDAGSWNALAATEQGSALPFVSVARNASTQPYSFGAVDSDAPALRGMGQGALSALRAARVRAGFAITPRASASTLARWSDAAPAFVSAEVGAGMLLVLGTSPEREASDLGLSPALPALAASVLSAASRAREPLSMTIGEPVWLGVSPDAEVGVTDTPGRTRRVLARELAQRPQSVLREPGIYRVEVAGQQRFLALNAPGPESARALATSGEIKNYFDEKERAVAPAANGWMDAAERRGHVWRLFLCAAFIVLVAELFFAMRGQGRARMKAEG
ncbi:MAG TPA: BatA domain-containing protein [Pyrinomonadaceae bacterium]